MNVMGNEFEVTHILLRVPPQGPEERRYKCPIVEAMNRLEEGSAMPDNECYEPGYTLAQMQIHLCEDNGWSEEQYRNWLGTLHVLDGINSYLKDDRKLRGYKTDSFKLRWMLRDADTSLEAMRIGITADKGLLWRDGKVIDLPEADSVASAFNFQCAEALVRAIVKWKGEGMTDQEFLDYCIVHSQTERGLFSFAQLQRLYSLAGKPFDPDIYTAENIGGADFAKLEHSLAAALVRAATIRDHA